MATDPSPSGPPVPLTDAGPASEGWLERAVLAHARESIVVTDAQLERLRPRIVYVNPAFERMTGFRADEARRRTPRMLQGPATDRRVSIPGSCSCWRWSAAPASSAPSAATRTARR